MSPFSLTTDVSEVTPNEIYYERESKSLTQRLVVPILPYVAPLHYESKSTGLTPIDKYKLIVTQQTMETTMSLVL